MFGIILISVITLMHLYVFWRTTSVPLIRRYVPRKYIIGTGAILWASFFAARIFAHGSTGTIAEVLELLGMNWMGMLFLFSISLLAIELVTGFGQLLPRLSPSLRGGALIAGGILSVIALVQGMRPPVVHDYEVRLHSLPAEMDGTVLIAMSDLHLGSLLDEQWLAARVAQVQEQRPDLVVLLGDIFEGHGQPQGEFLPILHHLSAPLGVWAVAGNHEFYGGLGASMSLISEAGFEVLHNRWTEIKPGFILAGIDDLTADYRAGKKNDFISQAVAGRPPGVTILLSHTPWQTEKAAAAGVDLMLSAHTHGGQIWPLDYLIRLSYPLLEGQHEVDSMQVIVCRGTGTWGPRMRLWCPGEILRVTLRCKQF
ncbi:MAG: metallophosphoesterase [Deltaproteobacteria bacterium]|nr:metallophosphoesterase [Deltaproteobacteria bacterium]